MRSLLLILAFTLTDDPDTLISQAAAQFPKAEYKQMLETLRRFPPSATATQRLRKNLLEAQALIQLGRYPEARGALDAARKFAAGLNSIDDQVRIEIAATNLSINTGERAASLTIAKRAVALALKGADPRVLVSAYRNLSRSYFEMEDWEQAIVTFRQALDAAGKPTTGDLLAYSQTAGAAYFQLNERDAAEREFKKAIEFAVQAGSKGAQAATQCNLGRLYWEVDRNRERALELLESSLKLAREVSTPAFEPVCTINRGNVWRDTGSYEQAIRDYKAAITQETRLGVRRDTALAQENMAQAYHMMGKLPDALALLESLTNASGNVSLRIQWMAHVELASVYEASGRRDDANAHYRRSLDILEEQRNTRLLDSSRTGSFAYSLDRYDPYERYIRFLSTRPDDTAGIQESFRASERARARGFLEALGAVRSSMIETLPANLLSQENEIFRSISSLQTQLRDSTLDETRRKLVLQEISAKERDLDDFRRRLRRDHAALSEARYPDIAGAGELQEMLRPGETVISYFLGTMASFRWVFRDGNLKLDSLPPRAEIESAVQRLRARITVPGYKEGLEKQTALVSALLLDGVDLSGSAPVIVIPHGVLQYIPFELLMSGGKMLVETHAITYAPSLNSLSWLRKKPVSTQPFRVAAIGDPTTNAAVNTAVAVRSVDIDAIGLLAPLPFSRQEVEDIRSRFFGQSLVLTGDHAKEARLSREDLSRYRVLHFATHGLINESHPNRSGLLLSAVKNGEDGFLQVPEIYRLRLNSDLVVLSACQTALGKEVTGEGMVGLARAFFFAGTRSVVASLWNLNDRFAADFMNEFYGRIQEGKAAEDALRETKAHFLRDPVYRDPFYWSPFILTGDGSRILYKDSDRLLATLPAQFGALTLVLGFVALAYWINSAMASPRCR